MKLVLILGDSLSLPRPDEGVKYEQTWPYLLQRIGRDELMVVNLSEGGASISTLRKKLEKYLGYYEPDCIILQLGIVDCAPRALRNWERFLVFRFPFFRSTIRNFLKKNHARISTARNITGTPIGKFEGELEKIKKTSAKTASGIVLPIAKAGFTLISSSPRVESNINLYNDRLQKFCAQYQLHLLPLPSLELLPDGHHLSVADHSKLARNIYLQLKKE